MELVHSELNWERIAVGWRKGDWISLVMETRVSASCSTFALKPRCHCPNPFCFLLLDLLAAAQGLSWRWPAHFWALGLPPLPQTLCDTLLISLLAPWLHSYCYLLLCIPLTLVSHFKQVSGFFAFPCICHDLPLNGVHPPEQSCSFQYVSSSLRLLPPSAPGCLLGGLPVNQLAFLVTRVIQASLQGLKSSAKFKPLNLKSSVFPTKNQVSIIGLPRPGDRCTKSLLSYGLDSNLVIKFLVCPMLGLVCCSRIFQGHIQNWCIHMCVYIYIYIHIYMCTIFVILNIWTTSRLVPKPKHEFNSDLNFHCNFFSAKYPIQTNN